MITYVSEYVHEFVINHLRRSQRPRLPVRPLLGFIEIRRPDKSRARRCEPDGRAPRYTERTLRARREAVPRHNVAPPEPNTDINHPLYLRDGLEVDDGRRGGGDAGKSRLERHAIW